LHGWETVGHEKQFPGITLAVNIFVENRGILQKQTKLIKSARYSAFYDWSSA
jgi:hypothetical protein